MLVDVISKNRLHDESELFLNMSGCFSPYGKISQLKRFVCAIWYEGKRVAFVVFVLDRITTSVYDLTRIVSVADSTFYNPFFVYVESEFRVEDDGCFFSMKLGLLSYVASLEELA